MSRGRNTRPTVEPARRGPTRGTALEPAEAGLDGILRAAAATLSAAGLDSPRSEAEQLLAATLDIPVGRLRALVAAEPSPGSGARRVTVQPRHAVYPGGQARAGVADDGPRGMTAERLRRFEDGVASRARRVPLQHLLGTAAFRTVELAVGPGAFVPRPETELIAGAAVAALRPPLRSSRGAGRGAPVAVDLGTGPGTIARALAAEVPGAVVHAVERDPAALNWARRNLAGTGVVLHACDMADLPRVSPALAGGADVVVSNPPYLPLGCRAALPPEVRDHDPPAALFGGPDGLDVIRVVVSVAAWLLRPGGRLVLEHGEEQGDRVLLLLDATGFTAAADHPDLLDRPRWATATWAGRRVESSGSAATGSHAGGG